MSFLVTHFANLLGRADHRILWLAKIPLLYGDIADISLIGYAKIIYASCLHCSISIGKNSSIDDGIVDISLCSKS